MKYSDLNLQVGSSWFLRFVVDVDSRSRSLQVSAVRFRPTMLARSGEKG